MLPDTSRMNTYSRGGTSFGVTRFGGCTIRRNCFSPPESYSDSPDWIA